MKAQTKKSILLLAFFYIFLANIFPFIEDIAEGYHDSMHIAQEGFIAFLCIVAIYIIWKEIIDNRHSVKSLEQSLKKVKKDKETYSQQVQVLRVGLLKVLNSQFEQWSLSKSEQEVALLLIKGLSFEQISQIRGTKEKTVRQQASTIYQKSNLDSRSHLAAYFLEDLF
ncbi:Regulatory protein LuxR [uncultured Gammaproteobacteria bacterium]|jgi:DNA-binding CsgD family transcriptional regulator|nr:Regulatory protein LuxR [uncultured Gammaproteobacteria bacterium]CAC9594431.1 Regulatory protein LuxR [uncultured Gammaproteobacteria bacterium]